LGLNETMNDTAPNVDVMRILIGLQNDQHFAFSDKKPSKEEKNMEITQNSDPVQLIHKYMMENENRFGLVAQSLVGSFSEKIWSQNYQLSYSALRFVLYYLILFLFSYF